MLKLTHVLVISVAFCSLSFADNAVQTSPPATTHPESDGQGAFLTDVFSFNDQLRLQIELAGQWEFRRDADNQGLSQGWHKGDGTFSQHIKIPGVPQAQGIGEPNARQKNFFIEPYWVRRTFQIPTLNERQRIWLRTGGILPAAEIYINGQLVGYTKSSRTQQRADITKLAKPGSENLLAIKICDFPKVRLDGIWEMSECCKIWTGVYGPIACEITDRFGVIDAYVQPQLATRSIKVTAALPEPADEPMQLTLRVRDGRNDIGITTIPLTTGQKDACTAVKLADFTPWSPEYPKLYTLNIVLRTLIDQKIRDKVDIRFGMREIETKNNKFYLNGNPIYVRAYGENQLYPETLCPPADKDWYLSRLKRARQYGMNAAKGCVEALPQPYIEAADEAGIMIIQEMPFGLSELRANRYTIEKDFRDFESRELDGLVRESRNHASVVAYSMSSEMEFSNQTQESFDYFSKELPRQTRKLAPHALVIDCTGYLNTADTKKGTRDTDFYASIIPTWMKEVLDETPVDSDLKHPTILHEYNWWSCYPDPNDRVKYPNTQFKTHWLDTLEKTAKENGQAELIPTYRKNSLKLQAICRKDGIEYARRCPNVEGYILWLLIDFGQYTEGLLDDFWNPKDVSAEEFSKSNGDTVILLAKEGIRCLPTGERAKIPLAVSHYGLTPLQDCTLRWHAKVGDASHQGELPIATLEVGQLTQAGAADIDLATVSKPCKFSLEVTLQHDGKTVNTNNWSFWAIPEPGKQYRDIAATRATGGSSTSAGSGATGGLPTSAWKDGTFPRLGKSTAAPIPANASLVIADKVDQPLIDYIEGGGRCLLLSKGAAIENTVKYYGDTTFYTTFRTIPWNAGASGNSGSVLAAHPALADFPHEDFCDLQFVWMIRNVLPMEFSPLRQYGVTPILRMIDHYASNRNNAHMLEFKVGKGRVLVTTLNILPNTTKHIEARYLLQCLANYARGESFTPSATVPTPDFVKLFTQRPDPKKAKGPDGLLK